MLTTDRGIYDKTIEEIAQRYPEVELLTQVYGVGTSLRLTFPERVAATGGKFASQEFNSVSTYLRSRL